jgi:hypothetical protein
LQFFERTHTHISTDSRRPLPRISDSIPILNISENFGLKSRIKSALREPKSNLNQGRKHLGVYQAGGMLQLVL